MDGRNSFYVLDPGGDLTDTQERLTKELRKYTFWRGTIGAAPKPEELRTFLETSDLFLQVLFFSLFSVFLHFFLKYFNFNGALGNPQNATNFCHSLFHPVLFLVIWDTEVVAGISEGRQYYEVIVGLCLF